MQSPCGKRNSLDDKELPDGHKEMPLGNVCVHSDGNEMPSGGGYSSIAEKRLPVETIGMPRNTKRMQSAAAGDRLTARRRKMENCG
jgi:hypothetical protein